MAAKKPLPPSDRLRRSLEQAKPRFWKATRFYLLLTGLRQGVINGRVFAETKQDIFELDSASVSSTLQSIRDAIDANAIRQAWKSDRGHYKTVENGIKKRILADIEHPWPVLPNEMESLTNRATAWRE